METTMEFSFASIDQEIRGLDLAGIRSNSFLAAQGTRIQRAVTIFRGLRPLLAAFAAMPIVPPYWRSALQLFVFTLDEIAASTPAPAIEGGDFKAGKDL